MRATVAVQRRAAAVVTEEQVVRTAVIVAARRRRPIAAAAANTAETATIGAAITRSRISDSLICSELTRVVHTFV